VEETEVEQWGKLEDLRTVLIEENGFSEEDADGLLESLGQALRGEGRVLRTGRLRRKGESMDEDLLRRAKAAANTTEDSVTYDEAALADLREEEKSVTTHILFIMDASGSMAHLANDVRGGFNEFVTRARIEEKNIRVTVTTFNSNEIAQLYKDVPVANTVLALTPDNYRPDGYTPLWDAVGKTLAAFRAEPVQHEDDKVIVQIETDGLENASKEHSAKSLRPVIEELQAAGWAFVFAGTGLDDWADAHASGLGGAFSRNAPTGLGTRSRYDASYVATVDFMEQELPPEKFSARMQEEIDKAGGNE
jgi:Mg-chelatase subunit ChlD